MSKYTIKDVQNAAYFLAVVCNDVHGSMEMNIKDVKHGGEVIGNYRITCTKISDEEYAELEESD